MAEVDNEADNSADDGGGDNEHDDNKGQLIMPTAAVPWQGGLSNNGIKRRGQNRADREGAGVDIGRLRDERWERGGKEWNIKKKG